MSIFGSTRAPASAIQLTSEDVKSQGQARRDKRPPRRRPRHVVIPGESDPIIAHHIAEMIEFLASYDDLIPGFYQKYTPTVYGNDDEDRPISVVQRLWILRCIVVGEYDCLTVTEMRSCFRQHFDEQVLEDKQALVQSSLLDLVDYFKMLSREAKQKLNTTIDLEIVSKHHKVLWGSKFDIPDLLVDTSRYTSPTEEPSKDARTRVSSSTTDVHRSGLFNESRLAIALGSPALTARHSPGSGEIPNLPTPPPRVHVPGERAAAGPITAPPSPRPASTSNLARPNRGSFLADLGRELFLRTPPSTPTSQPHSPTTRLGQPAPFSRLSERTRRSDLRRRDPR